MCKQKRKIFEKNTKLNINILNGTTRLNEISPNATPSNFSPPAGLNFYDPDLHNNSEFDENTMRHHHNPNFASTQPRHRISALPVAWATFALFIAALVAHQQYDQFPVADAAYRDIGKSATSATIDPNSVQTNIIKKMKDTSDENENEVHLDSHHHGYMNLSPLQDTVERGKPISKQITAKELYDAYQQIKAEYNEKAFNSDRNKNNPHQNTWKVIRETPNKEIEISILNHPSDPSCPYVRMRSVLPGEISDVWDFLSLENWETNMPKMDPFYESVELLGEYEHRNVQMVLARKTTKRLSVFGKRDFTFVSVSDREKSQDGVWVSGTLSIVTEKFPRYRGYTRAFQDSVAFYEDWGVDKVTGEKRTRLTIVCRIDLNDSGDGGDGGAIPMWIYVKTVGATGLLSIQNMKKEIENTLAEKRKKLKQILIDQEEETSSKGGKVEIAGGKISNPLIQFFKGQRKKKVANKFNDKTQDDEMNENSMVKEAKHTSFIQKIVSWRKLKKNTEKNDVIETVSKEENDT